MSQMVDEKSKEKTGQWAELMVELFDRLTGKGAEIAYNFQNLEIDIQTIFLLVTLTMVICTILNSTRIEPV